MALLPALCASAVSAQSNLLPNGGFETEPGNLGWLGNIELNSNINMPIGPIPDGTHYGSVQIGGGVPSRFAHTEPIVLNGDGPHELRLTGSWGGGTTCQLQGNFPPCLNLVNRTGVVRIRSQSQTGDIVAEVQQPLDHGPEGQDDPEIPNGFGWEPLNISGTTTSGSVVVQFGWDYGTTEWSNGTGIHVDALSLTREESSRCTDPHEPFADADDDGDVDQDDFGAWQQCVTDAGGPGIADLEPIAGYHCDCFDVTSLAGEPDGQIDQRDFQAFQACASGPAVTADPACDDATP